jgi:holo-[acyl-carrier protein] synthase
MTQAIKSMGLDIVSVARIKRLHEEYGQQFAGRIFTPVEMEYCENKRNPFPHLAARFAAKESLLKAVGLGLRDGLSWQQIGVINDPKGAPKLVLTGRASEILSEMEIVETLLSISHTDDLAVAEVLLLTQS